MKREDIVNFFAIALDPLDLRRFFGTPVDYEAQARAQMQKMQFDQYEWYKAKMEAEGQKPSRLLLHAAVKTEL